MAASSKKVGLSKGLMALGFMQRGPAVSQTEPAKPVVVEDGKWELGSAMQESWGQDTSIPQTVTYEESYLPFLTPEHASTSRLAPGGGGRKSFGRFNKSLETRPEEEELAADMMPEPESSHEEERDKLPRARKLVVNPASLISAEQVRRPWDQRTGEEVGRRKGGRREQRDGRGDSVSVDERTRGGEGRYRPRSPIGAPGASEDRTVRKNGKKRSRVEDEDKEEDTHSRREKKPKKDKQKEKNKGKQRSE
ncbi:hypothetical protein DACRYDRAFT_115276 [Dacryopinax primogenitus]|uniref:Uncharacterized protein n=1 Tax=Dacryopinax primogenitus (strain DJM 731) TaxID=1858805 RepID=M5GE53_DACPD|nr:uncharacterized protein DACRYDRAFT_115276 [Dacryopinax primogenitus]EJU02988.1 hypothetical protein DACRYDRAFT_115276 [Dacryopinax primogenitus]